MDTKLCLPPLKGPVACYLLTSLIVFLGVSFGHDYLRMPGHGLAKKRDLLATFANWDGEWYIKIAQRGYEYDPGRQSSVAFFPAYPLLGRLIAFVTGWRTDGALLLLSHLFLAGSFLLFAVYLSNRQPPLENREYSFALLAFGLWPMTCLCRMAYSESMFLFIAILVLYAMERRWPVFWIAFLIGLETAVRSVGVALLLPLAMYIWRQSGSLFDRCFDLLVLLPFSCWGLLAFMGFQEWRFGTPLAFVQTHENWFVHRPASLGEKLLALTSLKPVWSAFDPSAVCYWGGIGPFFNMSLANRFFFLLGLVLTGLGWGKKWLTGMEVALAAGLLAIPYVTRSYEMCMVSFGRFASIVFPVYIVFALLLGRMPLTMAMALLGVSGFLLGAFAALFAAWYPVF